MADPVKPSGEGAPDDAEAEFEKVRQHPTPLAGAMARRPGVSRNSRFRSLLRALRSSSSLLPQVLAGLSGDRTLEKFRGEYEKLFAALRKVRQPRSAVARRRRARFLLARALFATDHRESLRLRVDVFEGCFHWLRRNSSLPPALALPLNFLPSPPLPQSHTSERSLARKVAALNEELVSNGAPQRD
jgi:hypothetical protein